MVVYTPEEIVDMAERLMRDIASTEDIDAKMAASFADRCAEIIKNLAESMAILHQQVDILTEKSK